MVALPTTAVAYALRGIVTAILLGFAFCRLNRPRWNFCAFGLGVLAGIVVFGIWIAPDLLGWTTPAPVVDSPYSPAICGWPLTMAKLLASAFVISAAEELFFRKWLVDFAGFWWMVVLFAVEHGDRWHVGAITGVVYGLLARRFGLLSAIIAHTVTNLILGLYTIFFDRWFYW